MSKAEGENCLYGFPLWGKLSPQVTDEGATAGHFPLIRRASAPPSPKGGKAFPVEVFHRGVPYKPADSSQYSLKFFSNLTVPPCGGRFFTLFGVDFLQICINYNRFVIFDGQPAQRTDTPIGQCVCVVGFFPFLSVKFHLVFYPPPVYYNNCQRGRTSTSAPQKNHCKKKEKQL